MNRKRSIILILAAFAVCVSLTIFVYRINIEDNLDVVALNDITQSLEENWNQVGQIELPGDQYALDYVVLDENDHMIAATRRGLNEELNSAIAHRDTIINITRDKQLLGKLIIYNSSNDRLLEYRRELLTFVLIIFVVVAVFEILYVLYYDRRVFKPFRALQGFARQVAQGNLDIPLEMDRGNIFGAFTESFDLMRDEINRARENERLANQSKKELVASLSHDIKTPIASIKAVSELMYASSREDALREQIKMIDMKADQINTLITNLFNATLEELQELKVCVEERSSYQLYDLIQQADYNKRVGVSEIHECLILFDELRLLQVIDNVISNSYKYANTNIMVTTQIKGRYLEVCFCDQGPGVTDEERLLIFNKFYRAQNASNIQGTGLGLYISKYLMKRMQGEIDAENSANGFTIRLKLKIV